MCPLPGSLQRKGGGHTIVDSGLLGLMLLRAGWFVYAALDLEYSPGVLPHSIVRITLLEQYVTGRVYLTYCRSPPPREQGGLEEGEVREERGEGHGASDGSHLVLTVSPVTSEEGVLSEAPRPRQVVLHDGHHLGPLAPQVRVLPPLRALLHAQRQD